MCTARSDESDRMYLKRRSVPFAPLQAKLAPNRFLW